MAAIRSILVAVKDPRARAQPGARKGAQLARALGAKLELFHAIAEPLYADATSFTRGIHDAAERRRQEDLARLERLAARIGGEGLAITCSCTWDFPAYEAVLRRAARVRAELIVAERHEGHHAVPWLLRFNDWELLRRSPVPVLLVRQARPYDAPRILAAVDPRHEYAKPARLDGALLDLGHTLAGALGGEVHALHAWLAPAPSAGPIDVALPGVAATLARQVERGARTELDALASAHDVPPRRRHLVDGPPAEAIVATARRIGAQLVVMGAISRRGIKRLVIGNTAERALDALRCDVLVVKPAHFTSKVKAKTRGVRVYVPPMMV